jgi:hypothetical protein
MRRAFGTAALHSTKHQESRGIQRLDRSKFSRFVRLRTVKFYEILCNQHMMVWLIGSSWIGVVWSGS